LNFENKVVIVTGGGQGIGAAIAHEFSKNGASVILAEIDEEAGLEREEIIKRLGGECKFIRTDVSDEESVERMVEETINIYEKIDILVNNAAISCGGDIFTRPTSDWKRVIDVNLTGPYLCSKYAAKYMKEKGGVIINIASTRAFMSEPDTEPYSASKGGIIALTHSLAMSLSKYKIRVCAISPGWIEVSDWKKRSLRRPSKLREIDHRQHPVGRVGKPEDIAKACLYLSSEDAGFITGTNLIVDGGMTIKMIYAE